MFLNGRMKNFIKLAFVLVVLLHSAIVSALVNISCLKYEPAMVTLIGVLDSKVYPGEPNFVSIDAGDEPETSYFIVLKPPICTITREESWMLGHERISEVQLAVSKSQLDQLEANMGKVVTINGTLFEAFDNHHHTPVLMDVKSLVGVERSANPVVLKPEKAVNPAPNVAQPAKVTQPTKQVKPAKSSLVAKKTGAKKQVKKAKSSAVTKKSKAAKSKKPKK